MKTHTIGYLIYPNMQAMDLIGPLDAFDEANQWQERLHYKKVLIGIDDQPVNASNGVQFCPDSLINDIGHVDTLLIPGGAGSRVVNQNAQLIKHVINLSQHADRVVSICTGAYILAETGLMNRRRITTHWRHAEHLQQQYPNIHVSSEKLYIEDGKFFSSGGLTAGIDLALALIEKDLGKNLAQSVARDLVVYLRRPGNQAQFSLPLQAQTSSNNKLENLTNWLQDNLSNPITLTDMAAQANMSDRHLRRTFKQTFDQSPSQFLESLRIEQAKVLLGSTALSVLQIGNQVGYVNASVFSKQFKSRMGVSPSEYRARFT